jgi:hypothetical protein
MIGKNKTNEGHTRDLQVKSDMYTKKYKHKTRTSKANNINSHNRNSHSKTMCAPEGLTPVLLMPSIVKFYFPKRVKGNTYLHVILETCLKPVDINQYVLTTIESLIQRLNYKFLGMVKLFGRQR